MCCFILGLSLSLIRLLANGLVGLRSGFMCLLGCLKYCFRGVSRLLSSNFLLVSMLKESGC